MSQPRQIAAYVHDEQDASYIAFKMEEDADRLASLAATGPDFRSADYVANRLGHVAELAWDQAHHAQLLARLGLTPTYTVNQRAELVAVSVATPSSPNVAVTVNGEPLADRWANIAAGRTIYLGPEVSSSRAAEATAYVESIAGPQLTEAQTDQAPTYVPEAQRSAELPPPPPPQPPAPPLEVVR